VGFFQTAENPDLHARIVVEHLEHPRKAELNRLARDQRRANRLGDVSLCALHCQREHLFESDIDALERCEIGEPIFGGDVFEAFDLGHHVDEIGRVQDAEQARGVIPAFVVNLERHEPGLCQRQRWARQ
jgi:hypothetical protein